jgi:cytochrome c556
MATRKQALRVLAIAGVAAALAGGTALAAQTAAQTIAARQAGYKQMGAAFKTINDQLRAGSPDTAAIAAAAKRISDTSTAQFGWFPRGSGPEAGVKTRAKADIWSDPAGFAAAQKALQTEAAKMQRLATAKDVAGMKAQAKALGGACAGCHKPFRAEEG